MNNAQCQSPAATFAATTYCPWGAFVTSINGVSPGSGQYWALYVNGSFATGGLDTQAVPSGATVRWQLDSSSAAISAKPTSHQHHLLRAHTSS
jgi:hypothetical protein